MSKNKKIILIILSIFIVLSLFLGVSYAYYIKSHSQENSNIVKTKCLNFSITNEKNDINLDEQYPIPDTEGRKLTPYQFTITNTCEQFISYNVNLESLEATTMDSSAVKVMINNEAPVNLSTLESTSVSINTSKDSKILATGSLGSNDSVDYTLRLWMDYGTTADTSSMNKVFESKIVVTATVGTYKPSDYVTTLHDAILVNEYGVTDVNNAINRIEAKGTPDLSQTAPIIKWIENVSDTTSNVSVIKAASTMIKVDEYTNDLSENDTLMTLYRGISFNSDTSHYTLTDPIVADPAQLDFSDTNYYYVEDSIQFSKNHYWSHSSMDGIIVYQIIAANSEIVNKKIKSKYDATVYHLKVKTLSSYASETDKSDKGLYAAKDDYGTTYYYRGNVLNNNVNFAGFLWQIVRINGDGSIRLLYNNKYSEIATSSFNKTRNSPIYSGYMYGNENATTYKEAHENTNSSSVKMVVDSWYKNNIEENYSSYIEKKIGFCGNRTIISGDGISFNKDTTFSSYTPYINSTGSFLCENGSKQFNENDYYTVAEANIGNRKLTYPIGLISYDELAYSGLNRNYINNMAYTYSEKSYWTMTPFKYDSSYLTADVILMQSSGSISGWVPVSYNYSVRPVINLKADVEISGGIGTANDPYIIKTS